MNVSKKVVLMVIIVLLLINVFNLIVFITITGNATAVGISTICINPPPIIESLVGHEVAHNVEFSLNVNASDPRNNSLTYFDNSSLFTINGSGTINFTPNITQVGTSSIFITVQDNATGCPLNATESFNLVINNTIPTLSSVIQNQSWEKNVVLTGLDLDDYFTDNDGDSLSYSYISGDNITIEVNISNGVTFTPDTNWNGLTWVIFIANDSVDLRGSNNVTLNVSSDGAPPSIEFLGSYEGRNGSTLSIPLDINISEVGTISYQINDGRNITLCGGCTRGTKNISIPTYGNYTMTIYANDSSGNENSISGNFSQNMDTDGDGLPDADDGDRDNDGLNDTIDNLHFTINGSTNLTQQFTGFQFINFSNSTHGLLEFNHDFSSTLLQLARIVIEKQNATAVLGSSLVRGLNLTTGETKTMYIDKVNNSGNVCLRDVLVESLSEITPDCSGTNETLISCPGSSDAYTCTDTPTQYKLVGLLHSAGKEFNPAAETSGSGTTGGSSSSGGSGNVVSQRVIRDPEGECNEKRECADWGPDNCGLGETQTRVCLNTREDCSIIEQELERECPCKPSWECTIWLPQVCEEGAQTRKCLDVHSCGEESRLPLIQRCTPFVEEPGNVALVGQAFSSVFGLGKGNIKSLVWVLVSVVLIGALLAIVLVKLRRRPQNITLAEGSKIDTQDTTITLTKK
jgi:hypothetical protein